MAVMTTAQNTMIDPADAGHAEIMKGLPFSLFSNFEKKSGLSQEAIRKFVRLTPRLREMRKVSKRLSVMETERLVRLARILSLATNLYDGDRQVAAEWLEMPHDYFSGETLLERAQTEVGARDVEQLIGRLEHGVYS